jgi:hypothetical protein
MLRTMLRGAACAALLALATPAAAGTMNGVTPLAPKSGKSVEVGATVVFKARAKGGGSVWLHVCKNRKRNGDGVICNRTLIRQMRKRDGVYRWKEVEGGFPSHWLNTPGTYYWQVHRIKCEGGTADCRQEGEVRKLRVTAVTG